MPVTPPSRARRLHQQTSPDRGIALITAARRNPYPFLSLGVFLVAVYLCLANLDYVSLWHDEAVAAVIGKNLLEQGDITTWDGRNLFVCLGTMTNEALRYMDSPVQAALSAAGYVLFGVNEVGARALHALAGALALVFFYLVLRQQLPNHPRLIFFIFLLAAWSAQLLLFFRQARYYAVTVLCMMAGFYLYERYWRTRSLWVMAALTLVAALAFLNHYGVGAATLLSIAAYHLCLRARQTTRRDWAAFFAGGLLVGALALSYLLFIGIIGATLSPSEMFNQGQPEYTGPVPVFLLGLAVMARNLVPIDWISWPVLLWFVVFLLLLRPDRWVRGEVAKPSIRPVGRPARQPPPTQNAAMALPLTGIGRLLLLAFLFAVFSVALSPQPYWTNPSLILRYHLPLLPLLLVIKGLFIEWLWRRSRLLSSVALATLLFSNLGAWPFNAWNLHTGRSLLGAEPFLLAREIHRPYRNAIGVTVDYLLRHAQQDDLLWVARDFGDRDTLQFYLGRRLKFCNMVAPDSQLARFLPQTLPPHLLYGQCRPDWIVFFGPLQKADQENWEANGYRLVARPDVYWYVTQRPGPWHAWEPLPPVDYPGVYIFAAPGKVAADKK